MMDIDKFKKLDDLPKGKPNSYEDVMKAMAVLFKMVTRQSHAYGGKNSKLLPAGIAETSLLRSVTSTELHEDEETARLLDLAYERADKLKDHLKKNNDEEGARMLSALLQMLGASVAAADDKPKKAT